MTTLPAQAPKPSLAGSDRGSLFVGLMLKVALVLAVVALVGHDVLGIVTTHLKVADDASEVALSARDALDAPGGTPAMAVAAARRMALVRGYAIGPDAVQVRGPEVTVTLHDTAPTLLAMRLPVTRAWTSIEAEGHARSLAHA